MIEFLTTPLAWPDDFTVAHALMMIILWVLPYLAVLQNQSRIEKLERKLDSTIWRLRTFYGLGVTNPKEE